MPMDRNEGCEMVTELREAYLSLKSFAMEVHGALTEVASARSRTMLQAYDFNVVRNYELDTCIGRTELRADPVRWHCVMEGHPLDHTPAILGEYIIRQLRDNVAEGFANAIYNSLAQTQTRP